MATITVHAGESIQMAIDSATTSDIIQVEAGTYASFVIDPAGGHGVDGLTIVGTGNVIIQGDFNDHNGLAPTDSVADFLKTNPVGYQDGATNGVKILASGITIENVQISGFGIGIELGNGLYTSDQYDLQNITLTDVTLSGNLTGLNKEGAVGIDNLIVNGGSISDGHFGINMNKTMTPGDGAIGMATNVTIDGTHFSNLTEKGIYVETLSDSTITNVVMNDVGQYGRTLPFGPASQIGGFGAGIDINLKNGTYHDITISDFTFTGVGESSKDGTADSSATGTAIGIKARDDGSYGTAPATYTGHVTIENGTIDGTSTGIRAGEPGKNIGGPDVNVQNVWIQHETIADYDNVTQKTLDVTGTAGNETFSVAPTTIGDVVLHGDGGNDIYTIHQGNTVVEAANGGTDEVRSTESVTASDNVENVTLLDGASNTQTFDDMSLGAITNGKNGWKVNSNVDQAVVDDGTGNQVFHISSDGEQGPNGAFGGPYSPGLSASAGEKAAGAAYQGHSISFDVKAVSEVADNSRIEVDFANAAGNDRNNFMVIESVAGHGIRIAVSEPTADGQHFTGEDNGSFPNDWIQLISDVDPSVSHHIELRLDYVDGANNDVIDVYLDGNKIGSTTTFENYHDGIVGDHVGNAQDNFTDRVIFRESNNGQPTDGVEGQNQGFNFDNLTSIVYNNTDATGNDQDNVITGNSGDNVLTGAGGNDTIDGSAGIDTANYTGTVNAADLTANGSTWTVAAGAEGTDTLSNVEVVHSASNNILLVGSGGYATIQAAVNAAHDGDTILVSAGTYNEQVTVNGLHGLTIEGVGAVTVTAPSTLSQTATAPTNGRSIDGIITVVDSDDVTITHLTVDGQSHGASFAGGQTNPTLVGISYINSDEGIIDHVTVTGIRESEGGFGNQRNVGIYVLNTDPSLGATPTADDIANDTLNSITITNSIVTDFQKTGIAVANANVDIHDNTVTGVGATSLTAQNGIQVSGSTGSVAHNHVSDVGYIPTTFVSTSILTFNNNGLSITDNTIDAATDSGQPVSTEGIDVSDSVNGVVTGNAVHNAGFAINGFSEALSSDDLGGTFTISGNTVDGVPAFVGAYPGTGVDFETTPSTSTSPMTIEGTDSTDFISGAEGGDTLSGLGGEDEIHGNGGDDSITGGGGNDTVDGGAGKDTVNYTGTVTTAELTANGSTWTVAAGADGADTVSNIEVVHSAGGGNILLVGSGGYTTIQAAVTAAHNGDTVLIASGDYTENVTISGKDITLQGMGDDQTTLHGQITVDGTVNGNLAIKGIDVDATGHQYAVFVSANSTAFAGGIALDGVTLENAEQNGFAYIRAGNGSTPTLTDTVGSISILNSSLTHNATHTGGGGGAGDIIIFGYNQDLTIADVTISDAGASAQKAIQLRGVQDGGDVGNAGPYDHAGDVVLSNVNITGTYLQDLLAFYRIADFDSFTTSGVVINASAPWGLFNFDEVGGTIDLSNGITATNLSGSGLIANPQGLSTGDTFIGTSGIDTIVGRAGDDDLTGNGGNDIIDGGAGKDTAHFSGTVMSDEISYDATTGSWVVNNANDGNGTDHLKGIETITDGAGHTYALVGGDSEYTSNEAAPEGATILHTTPSAATDTDGDVNVLAEGAANGTSAQITAHSTDTGGAVTYELVGDKHGFTIDETTGEVTVENGALIDYENSGSDHQFQITVRATNTVGGGTTDTDFTIGVTDIAPTLATTLGTASVAEGFSGVIGNVRGTGGDTSSVSYSIIPNADGALFSIDAAGNLSFNNPPDFENRLDQDGDNIYHVNVLAFDDGNFIPKSYDIAVTNQGLGLLTDTNADTNRVFENAAAGTVVGIIASATDGSGTPTYSIVSGNANGAFAINATTGLVTVADGSQIDFETTGPSHSQTITVQAQSGVDTAEASFTIGIDDATGSTINGSSGGETINGTSGAGGVQEGSNLATVEADTIHGNGGNDTIDGLAGDDIITGDAGNDTLDGSAGGDELTGGPGKDIVRGGADDDTLHVKGTDDVSDVIDGGDDNDTVVVDGGGNVTLVAVNNGAALDTDIGVHNVENWIGNEAGLIGTSADNVFDFSNITATDLAFIDGGTGDDVITAGNDANYVLRGGTGNDALTGGDGDDTLTGGKGGDTLDGGDGVNTVSYAGSSAAVTVNLATPSAAGGDATGDTLENFQNIIGSSKNDTLTGDTGANELTGGAGVDAISGGDGDDTIHVSGTGDTTDIIDGGDDDDTLQVDGTGKLTMAGFNGVASHIENFVGNGEGLLGNTKGNTFDFTNVDVSGLSEVNGGSGDDTIIAGDDALRMIGGAGVDTLTGGASDDTIVISGTGDANDTISGGGGTGDTVEVGGTGNVTLVDFDTTANGIEQWDGNGKALLGTSADNAFDLSGLTGIDGLAYVDGSSGDDHITGNDNASLELRGGSGDDVLTAGSHGDTLIGGSGTDTLVGGAGDDTFVISGTGDSGDTFSGNGGSNTIKATGNVTLFAFDADGDKISGWTGTGNFHVTGTAQGNTLDFSSLTSVDHLAYVDGGSGADTIIGSDVWAGDLRGGAGNDTLTGGAMDDKLTGGSGSDTFVFNGGNDTIMDFTVKSKTVENTTLDDHIDLTSFDFNDYMADVHILMTQDNKNVVIDFGGGDTLTIKNTTIDILDHHHTDFHLV